MPRLLSVRSQDGQKGGSPDFTLVTMLWSLFAVNCQIL